MRLKDKIPAQTMDTDLILTVNLFNSYLKNKYLVGLGSCPCGVEKKGVELLVAPLIPRIVKILMHTFACLFNILLYIVVDPAAKIRCGFLKK